MKALLITTGNEIRLVEIENFATDITNHIGCEYFEIVRAERLRMPVVMLVDEYGSLKHLPRNQTGCYLYRTDVHGSPIFGDALIMRSAWSNSGRELAGLTEDDIKKMKKLPGLNGLKGIV